MLAESQRVLINSSLVFSRWVGDYPVIPLSLGWGTVEELEHPGEAQSRATFCFKRSQLRWFGHLVLVPPGCLPGEVFQACLSGRRPKSSWRDYISRQVRECLGVLLEELVEVDG